MREPGGHRIDDEGQQDAPDPGPKTMLPRRLLFEARPARHPEVEDPPHARGNRPMRLKDEIAILKGQKPRFSRNLPEFCGHSHLEVEVLRAGSVFLGCNSSQLFKNTKKSDLMVHSAF